jgi:CubicO group peptidase (beta-lactamase class C family)
MAKLGLLYLNDGEWEGNQIVPADWVHNSLRTYSEDAWDNIGRFRDNGHGYQCWSARAGDQHVNFAWGHGRQLIVLMDELDMVVVTTADPFWLEHNDESWKHEKATISLVADFIASLPSE